MFSVVDTLLIRPLPFAVADRLVEVWARAPGGMRGSSRFSAAAARELRAQTDLFTAVEGYQFGAGTITGVGEPTRVTSPRVTVGLMSMLGVAPRLGRLFTEQDEGTAVPVAIISESLWRGRLGADPDVLGRQVTLDEVAYTIVGVVPESFRFPEARSAIWRVMPSNGSGAEFRGARGMMFTVGLLPHGISRAQTDARLLGLTPAFRQAGHIATSTREPESRFLSTGEPIQKAAMAEYRPALVLMFGAVALVLAIACVNVANLLLVRASLREGELALLATLGSSRMELAGQMAAEGLLLGLVGGAAGLWVARGVLAGIESILPPEMTVLAGVTASLDWRVLAFGGTLSVATCVAVSLLPAWRASRVDLVTVINRRASSIAGARDERWQAWLLSGQLAAVVVLLCGTSLLATSFARLVSVDPGFDVEGLTVFELPFSSPRYAAPGRGLEFARNLERDIELDVDVLDVTVAQGAPPRAGAIMFGDPGESLEVDGHTAVVPTGNEWIVAAVGHDYFETMRIALVEGRTFGADESEPVTIINTLMARRFWGDRSPVGDRIRTDRDDPWHAIVGVVGDVAQSGLDDRLGGGMEMYRPLAWARQVRQLALIVRAAPGSRDVVNRVKSLIRAVDPDLPVAAGAMGERLLESVWQPRFFSRLALAFTLLAAVIGAVGIYGTAAFWVTRRRRELAVRAAIGASRGHLIHLVFRRGLMAGALGLLVGLGVSLKGAGVVEGMLFATSPTDPLALGGVALVLAGLLVAGCLVPALRAARMDPAQVLRSE